MRRNNKEHSLQVSCVNWFNMQYKDDIAFIKSTPNGGKRSKITASQSKLAGEMSGASDLEVHIKGNYTVFIELKTPETEFINPKTMRVNKKAGGKQSQAQKDFQGKVENLGYPYYLIDNLDDFIKIMHSEVDRATKGGHNNN